MIPAASHDAFQQEAGPEAEELKLEPRMQASLGKSAMLHRGCCQGAISTCCADEGVWDAEGRACNGVPVDNGMKTSVVSAWLYHQQLAKAAAKFLSL